MTKISPVALVAGTDDLFTGDDVPRPGGHGPGLALPNRKATTRRRRPLRPAWPVSVAEAADPATPSHRLDRLEQQMEQHREAMRRGFDTLDRQGADLMFLMLSLPELLHGNRLEFSIRSKGIICRAVAEPPYRGRCPCCVSTTVLTPEGQPIRGAEFDHFFHGRLNRPEVGWLICGPCHDGLSHSGYPARAAQLPAFHLFQEAVLRQRELNRQANRARTA